MRLLQEYIAAPTEPQKTGYLNGLLIDLVNDSAAVAYAKAAGQEIVQKLWLQEDTPYVIGWQITWTQWFYLPQPLNPGGYKESPVPVQSGDATPLANPELPPYFGALDQDDYANGSIFDGMALVNPQFYAQPDGNQFISWLRKADQIEFQRTIFKFTITWIGSPIGNWDAQMYSNEPRPTTWNPPLSKNPYILFDDPFV